jgi:exopolyphosphatase / guanosine-5'-triphosphate,3'-diphosphate pyrophosphatase
MQRCAAIDIGSQTIRLLIADCDNQVIFPLKRDRTIIQLGAGMHADFLLPEKIERAAACIAQFCAHAREHGALDIYAVATACVRQAVNRQDFLNRVNQISGIMPVVLTGEKEAQLACAGVQSVIPGLTGESVIIDIGGGSTELCFLKQGKLQKSISLSLGVIDAAERFLRTDPPSAADIAGLRSWTGAILTTGIGTPAPQTGSDVPALIATAGTATTLAAMDIGLHDYQPERITTHRLSVTAMENMLHTMLGLACEQRAMLPGLEPGRARVIIPGTVILLSLMQHFRAGTCTVSDAGLLEGILLEHGGIKKIIEKA